MPKKTPRTVRRGLAAGAHVGRQVEAARLINPTTFDASNCHLAGRCPHAELSALLLEILSGDGGRWPAMTSDEGVWAERKARIRHIARSFGAVVREFRATLPQSERKRAARARRATAGGRGRQRGGAAAPDPPRARQIVARATRHPLPPSVPRVGRGEVNEQIKELIVNKDYAAVRRQIDNGLDLRTILHGGYSNFFNGGLDHMLEDHVYHYLALNQILLHGWADILHMNERPTWLLPPTPVNPEGAEEAYFRRGLAAPPEAVSARERLRQKCMWAVLDLKRHPHDFRHNRNMPLFTRFRDRLNNGEATLEDARLFCKDVLFAELVGLAHVFLYNELRHGGEARRNNEHAVADALEDANVPNAGSFNVEETVYDCVTIMFGGLRLPYDHERALAEEGGRLLSTALAL